MQKLFTQFLLIALLIGGGAIFSQLDFASLPLGSSGNQQQSAADAGPQDPPAGEVIRVASFNIQVFGQSKLKKPRAMAILAATARNFDLLAVQEIRSAKQDVLPRFVELINAEGAQYDYAISPRLGRTSSKEQYAFIYNTKTIALDRHGMYVVNDPDDLLHREPFVAGFRTLGVPENEAFTFTLINIHTDPDETDQELDALDDVFASVQRNGEDDVILLGDLNVDEYHLGELGR
ncbi:MAG: endonuclease/exonuclease/phosphatase family protein, partial [Planctomycetales bacterium]